MDSSGRIKEFANMEEAKKEGYDLPLSEDEARRLENENEAARKQYYATKQALKLGAQLDGPMPPPQRDGRFTKKDKSINKKKRKMIKNSRKRNRR